MPERSGIELVAENKFSKTFDAYDKALAKVERHSESAARKVTQAGKTQNQSFANVGMALGKLAIGYAGAAAAATTAFATIRQAAELANVAAEAQSIERSFYTMAHGAGVAGNELLEAMTRAAGGTIEQTKLMRIANRAFLADASGAFAKDLPRLMEIARATSLATGQSFEYVFDTLVTGIAKGSPLLIDNAEIYLRLGDAVDAYAAKLGKSADELTPTEKRMATLNAVLDQGQGIIARFGSEIEDATEPMKSAQAALADISVELGEAALPLTQAWTQAKADLLRQLIPVVDRLKDFVAYVHIGGMAVNEMVKEVSSWGEILRMGPAAAIPALVAKLTDAETRQDAWNRITEKSLDIWDQYHRDLSDVGDAVATTPIAPPVEEAKTDWEAIANAVEDTLNRIGKMQRDHERQLQREAEDAARERARAWDIYEKKVADAVKDGAKKLEKLEANYEKERTKAIADYQKEIAKAETDTQKERIKAQEDFERQARQSRERFQLSQIQSERRYQYERQKLIAEGDTLAIEDLDERYKLEQQESQENEALRQRQDKENQAQSLRETAQAAKEQLNELQQQLNEQLSEQETNYQEQIEAQRQANAERLVEMSTDFAERQRLEDENRMIAAQRREEDYRLQLEELGSSLADQLKEHEYGAENVAQILEQFYGPGGLADAILQGYHEREAQRIAITAEQLAAMGTTTPTMPTPTVPTPTMPTSPYSSPVFGLQHGGIVRGPMNFHVEPGMVEAVVPLNRMGGAMHHSFDPLNVDIPSLAGAPQQDVNAIASLLAKELTSQIRTLRRS